MAERIELEHLVKVYPGGNRALDDVSIDVEPGTFLVLLGPSGSGKTTLLRCVAGIERITGGVMRFGGTTVADTNLHLPPDRRNLSMVFQDYALWPHLVARDNVAFAMRRTGASKAEGRAAAEAMLERVGLGRLAGRYPSELSGGEQQRVALARALVADTHLVLCDEPLSNLDADLRERMRVEISTLVRQAGATTIYITHDQAEAFALADRVGVLERGRLVQLDAPEEVYARPASPFVARFTGLAGELDVEVLKMLGPDLAEVLPAVPGASSLEATLGAGARTSGNGRLMIRPSAVRLCATDTDEHHVLGEVRDVAFRGRGYEHAVVLSDGTQINGVFADLRVERGARVGVRFESTGCMVFPASSKGDPALETDAPVDAAAADPLEAAAAAAMRF